MMNYNDKPTSPPEIPVPSGPVQKSDVQCKSCGSLSSIDPCYMVNIKIWKQHSN